jgi:hypothetical protein
VRLHREEMTDCWLLCAENDISGEALIRLGHDELRELGVVSVGHRLSILKNVYTIKMAHDIPMDPDDYIPVCTCSRPQVALSS